MDDGRKRSRPPEVSSSSRTRRRFNHFNYPDAKRRNMMKAIAAVLVVYAHAPETRSPNSEQYRRARRRSTPVQGFPEDFSLEASFVKLLDLLRPTLRRTSALDVSMI